MAVFSLKRTYYANFWGPYFIFGYYQSGFTSLILKKLICFLMQTTAAAALFFQDFCLCLRHSVLGLLCSDWPV